MQRSFCGTTTIVGGPRGGQISVLDGAHIAERKLNESLRLRGRADEFDIDRLLAIDVNDGTKVAPAEAVFREISLKDDSIQFANAHGAQAGYAVTRADTISRSTVAQCCATIAFVR